MQSTSTTNKLLVVFGHGKETSLGHHLLDVVQETVQQRGVDARLHDLLADGFDPVLRLRAGELHAPRCSPDRDPLVHRYQEDVRWADCYVILHPVWWFAPPAILKGWADRVLVDEVALNHRPNAAPQPLLRGRRALVIQTFNTSAWVDRWLFRGVAGRFWSHAVFASCGVREVRRLAVHGVEGMDAARLKATGRRLRRAMDLLLRQP
ncbi:MAG TPA: NAD(P)H-dependent oxidoreductase [Planctomycetota bacterium]